VPVRLLHEDEYETWAAESSARYAQSMIDHAGWEPARAREKARQDYAELLPRGLATPHHAIFAIEDGGDVAGHLWVAEREWIGGTNLFVYEVEILERFRGRGLGRAAMLFAEEEARRRGLPRVELNVFGGNEVARSLYRSLGYVESAVHMVKPLGPAL
jgi:ribosomal protein S18 acetylase RimI-like enzyme